MLGHFKPRPKLKHVNRNKVGCPICGKNLQRNSYARHVKTHGKNVKEVPPPCQLNIGSKFITEEKLETHYEKSITYSKEKQKDVKIQCKDNGNDMNNLSNLNETSVSFDESALITTVKNANKNSKEDDSPIMCVFCDFVCYSDNDINQHHTDRHKSKKMVDFGNLLTKKMSLLICAHILDENQAADMNTMKLNVGSWLKDHGIKSFYSVSCNKSMSEGVRNAVSLTGLGKLSPKFNCISSIYVICSIIDGHHGP